MAQRILGLDPGLAILGFGALNCRAKASDADQETSVALVDFGIIHTPATLGLGQRLAMIYDDLSALLQTIQPDLVALEKLFFYRMGNTIAVAQARGVALLVLSQYGAPMMEFTPAQVKQALTGYGNADKQSVQQAVARELNLYQTPKPDDAADALAIALAAWFQQDCDG